MKIKSIHPLRAHAPALIILILMIVYLIISLPLPAEAPVQFTSGGAPGRIGSPWESIGITLGLSLFFLGLTVFLDELWVKQEKKKYFNWLSLLDELVIGAMVGINIGYLSYLNDNSGEFSFPWGWVIILAGGGMLIAAILESLRPFHPRAEQLEVEEDSALKAELERRISDNSTFVYWDSQNPVYVTILTTVLPVGMIVAGIFTWVTQPWVSVLLIITGVALVIPMGGQRIIVTKQNVTVRWGIFGIRVLRLNIAEITGAEPHEFSPLKDFGGYGIRQNREMKAYYLNGSVAVKLETSAGRKYLIGSDNPAHLATVINTIITNNPG